MLGLQERTNVKYVNYVIRYSKSLCEKMRGSLNITF